MQIVAAATLLSLLCLSACFAVNNNECLMTRFQEMSLDYHFKIEQEVGSSTHAFFGFNGNSQLFLTNDIQKSSAKLKVTLDQCHVYANKGN